MTYTGKDIIALGIEGGPHIPAMIARANETGICTYDSLKDLLPKPKMALKDPIVGGFNRGELSTIASGSAVEKSLFLANLGVNISIRDNQDEIDNVNAVLDTMAELSKTPVVESVTVMPDACPAGPVGTIPVGGVVASPHIHPGMHSADVCCSVMVSTYESLAPAELMERVYSRTHFGPGGRPEYKMSDALRERVRSNPITRQFEDVADYHMGTQGDGNHFSFVGTLKSTGATTLVTHHGSRGFGARVYKTGMRIAERYRQKLSPDTLKQNAWIPWGTEDFDIYMEALEIVQEWTMENHYAIHGEESEMLTWTRHNFVFERDGMILHAKGATPAWSDGVEAIPLNMAEPVLIVKGHDNPNALGFCPHGAGRNYSRSEHARRGIADLERETEGLDIRFWSGVPDTSELPSAYKDAATVRRDIEHFDLATVVDEVLPYGTIMAGEIEKFWK